MLTAAAIPAARLLSGCAAIVTKPYYIGCKGTPCGSVTDSEGWVYSVALGGNGYYQIFQSRNGIINQLTFANGNSWDPALTTDQSRIMFYTDRASTSSARLVDQWVMTVGGCEQAVLSDDPEEWLANNLNVFVVNGQSLAAGANSGPPVSTTAYGKNTTLQGGPLDLGNFTPVTYPESLVPLIEMDYGGSGYETPCSGAANQFAYLCQSFANVLPSISAASAAAGGRSLAQLFEHAPYGIPPQSDSYPWSLAQSSAFSRLASPGKAMRLRATLFVHGETDSANGNTGYEAELKNDYQQWMVDLAANGGDTTPPCFLTQTSSEAGYGHQFINIISPQQLQICLDNPGRFFMVGPEYCLQANFDVGGVHLLAAGYQWLGMMLGTAAFRALVLRQRWTGLIPDTITRSGPTILVAMRVPPPIGLNAPLGLVIDTSSIAPATQVGGLYGFEVRDARTTIVPIASVTIEPDDSG